MNQLDNKPIPVNWKHCQVCWSKSHVCSSQMATTSNPEFCPIGG